VRVVGRLWTRGPGTLEVGDHTQFLGGRAGIDLHALPHGCIRLGSGCLIREGVSIEATELVQLGDRVTVSEWARILDNDFHVLRGRRDDRPPSEPVLIGNDVVIGAHAIILPGAHLENGARVAPRAVVRRRVGAGLVAIGNPARVVRNS
jgi:acetyltransferase-like isoleucine patch superfamily enzyme